MSPNRLLLKYAAKFPWQILLTLVLGFSSAVFNGVGTALLVPLLLGIVSDKFIEPNRVPPSLQGFMSLFEGLSGDSKTLAMFGVVLGIIIVKNVTTYISSLTGGQLSRSLVNSMKLDGINLLLEVDLDFYAKKKAGDLLSHLSHDISQAANSINILVSILRLAITALTYLIILFSISWQLTLLSTVMMIVFFAINQFFVQLSRRLGRNISKKSKTYSNKILEILNANRLIRTVKTEDKEYQKTQQFITELEKAQFKLQANDYALPSINEVLGIIILLAIVIVGIYLFSGNQQSIATILLTYVVVLYKLIPVVSQLNYSRNQLAYKTHSIQITADFLNRKNKPLMVKNPQPHRYTQLTQGICFENVSFSYPGSERQILDGIDLWIPKGKTIALVGFSGAGKSTLADLLARFYDPTSGRITIDGIDLRELDLNSYRKAMGIVSQDTFLFNNSVAYNITYGLEEVTSDQLIEVAKLANAYEFIMQLPHGFDTEIGERGVMLSGGQRQRLAIARALIRNPDILILDEATSALDTASERQVQQAIDKLCENRTILAIAHRLSTIEKAYQIAVMERGRIVELGSHSELLARNGDYARLYSLQFSERAPEAKLSYR
jgi:subfamily B ATP-binding cassette protein MsbA